MYLSNMSPHSGRPLAPYPGASTRMSFPGSAPTRKKLSSRVRPYGQKVRYIIARNDEVFDPHSFLARMKQGFSSKDRVK